MGFQLALPRGPGAGSRLLSAGLPDGIVCSSDGAVVWWNAAGLFRWDGTLDDGISVRWAPTGPVSDVVWTGDRLVAVLDGDDCAEVALLGVGPMQSGALTGVAAEQVRAGHDQLVIRQAGRNRIERLDGAPASPLPIGAQRGRLVPWSSPPGWTWLDGGVLYRRALGGRTTTGGTHPPKVTGMASGPSGATVLMTEEAARLVAPGSRPVDWPHVVEDLAFSPDGRRALLDNGRAVHDVGLADATIHHSWDDSSVAVGYRPAPTCLDLHTGDLVDAAGQRVALGLRPWGTCAHGSRVYGPQAAAWDLSAGLPVWTHPALEAEALVADARAIVALRDGELTILSPSGDIVAQSSVPQAFLDDQASLVAVNGGRLLWRRSDQGWSTAMDGTDTRPDEGAPANAPQGGIIDAGGRTWTWTVAGLLLALAQPT